jgi:hypothetical protein
MIPTVVAPHPLIPSPQAGRGDKAQLWRGGVLLCLVSNKRGHDIINQKVIFIRQFIVTHRDD